MTRSVSRVDPAFAGTGASAPLVRVRGVGIRHEDATEATPADATFSVAAGEVVLLLGPSGSGKSSLALALNGLIPHAIPAEVSGTIEVAGTDTAHATVAQLSTSVGMVFQDPDAQLVTGTVFDEVAFGPENLRMPVGDVLARTERALRDTGLWERRADNPDTLSGGGRQRLAIASALAMGSPVLVLDEPTANLDPRGIDDVYRALGEITATHPDRAIVLIEHNLDAAVQLATRVVVLDGAGRTVADDSVDAVLRDDAERLHDLGVWLPITTLAAMRLRRAGWRFDRLPVTADELATALAATDTAPASAPDTAAERGHAPKPSPARAPARTPAPHPHPAIDPAIEVTGLTLRRGRNEVLHDVNLAISPGEFVALVGANGAGKTSLIQALAGVIRPPRGSVRVAGRDITRTAARDLSRHVGFVFQNPEHQFIAHTVFDEVAHGLRLLTLSDAEVTARTTALLTRLGLTDKATQHPFLLSGGQKRRLSVGTALVTGAQILALDEPTFGQDRARADELMTLLRDLNAEGTTVVIVTHDMQLVTEYARRTIVVAEGRIAADGPTDAVFADDALLTASGLSAPPLARALRGATHPQLAGRTRLTELPGAS